MPHGLPDYYRGVDIAYQALAQLMIRPTYGAAKCKAGYKDVTAWVETELCSVTSKGMIYGGAVFVKYDSTQRKGRPFLIIDGVTFLGETFENMKVYGFDKVHSMPLYLLKYSENEPIADEDVFIYTVGISPGYTFETGFSLNYEENHGDSLAVNYQVLYALV